MNHSFYESVPLWRVVMFVPFGDAFNVVEVLESALQPLSSAIGDLPEGDHQLLGFDDYIDPSALIRVELLFDTPLTPLEFSVALEALALPNYTVTVDKVQNKDWIQQNLRELKRIVVPPIMIKGSYDANPEFKKHVYVIDAGLAFGTGHHDTTIGCVNALLYLQKNSQFKPKRLLDVGTGTGILGFIMHNYYQQPVVFSDYDPIAIAVAQYNNRKNHFSALNQFYVAKGFNHPNIRTQGPFDCITANILAKPLILMVKDMRDFTQKGSKIVLSGILQKQAHSVIQIYQNHQFKLHKWFRKGDWCSLIFDRI